MGTAYTPLPTSPTASRSSLEDGNEDQDKRPMLPYYHDLPPAPASVHATDEKRSGPEFALGGDGAFDESTTPLRLGSGHGRAHAHGLCRRARHARQAGAAAVRGMWARIGWAIKTVLVLSLLWGASRALFHGRRCGRHGRGGPGGPGGERMRILEPVRALYTTLRTDAGAGLEYSNTSFPLKDLQELGLELPSMQSGELLVYYKDMNEYTGESTKDGEVVVERVCRSADDVALVSASTDEKDVQLWSDGESAFVQVADTDSCSTRMHLVLAQHAPVPRIRTTLVPTYLNKDDAPALRDLELVKDTHDITGKFNLTAHGMLFLRTQTGAVDVDVTLLPPPFMRGPRRGPPGRKGPKKEEEEVDEQGQDEEDESVEGHEPRGPPPPPPHKGPEGGEPGRDGPGRHPHGPPPPPPPHKGPKGGEPGRDGPGHHPHGPPPPPPPHRGPPHPPHRGPRPPPPPPPTRLVALSQTGDVTLRVHRLAPPHNVSDVEEVESLNEDESDEQERDEDESADKHKHKHEHKHKHHDDKSKPHPHPHPHPPHPPHRRPHPHPTHIFTHTVHGSVSVSLAHAHYAGFFRAATVEGKVKVTASDDKEVVVLREWVTEAGGGVQGFVRFKRQGNATEEDEQPDFGYDFDQEEANDGERRDEPGSGPGGPGGQRPPAPPGPPGGPRHPGHPAHPHPHPAPPHGPHHPGGPRPPGPPGANWVVAETVKGDVTLRL